MLEEQKPGSAIFIRNFMGNFIGNFLLQFHRKNFISYEPMNCPMKSSYCKSTKFRVRFNFVNFAILANFEKIKCANYIVQLAL